MREYHKGRRCLRIFLHVTGTYPIDHDDFLSHENFTVSTYYVLYRTIVLISYRIISFVIRVFHVFSVLFALATTTAAVIFLYIIHALYYSRK